MLTVSETKLVEKTILRGTIGTAVSIPLLLWLEPKKRSGELSPFAYYVFFLALDVTLSLFIARLAEGVYHDSEAGLIPDDSSGLPSDPR